MPHTLATVLVGPVVSAAGLLFGVHPGTDAVILLVFLPLVLFQAALEVDVHALGRALPVAGFRRLVRRQATGDL